MQMEGFVQGRILGFQGNAGVIQGDDQARYPFTSADWFEDDAPQRGALVDFVVEEGTARQIYVALGTRQPGPASLKPAPALNDAAALGGEIADKFRAASQRDDTMGDVLARIKLAPQMAVAVLILLACFAMNFMSLGFENRALQQWGMLGMRTELTLLEIPTEADHMRTGQEEGREKIREQLDQIDTMATSSVGRSPYQLEIEKRLKDADRELGKLDNILLLTNAVWLVPLLAALTIVAGWMRNATVKPLGTVLGVVSCAVAFIPHLWEKQIVALIEAFVPKGDVLNTARRAAQKGFEMELGAWVLIALGLACIFLGVARRAAAEGE
jgi:hypothetical protein